MALVSRQPCPSWQTLGNQIASVLSLHASLMTSLIQKKDRWKKSAPVLRFRGAKAAWMGQICADTLIISLKQGISGLRMVRCRLDPPPYPGPRPRMTRSPAGLLVFLLSGVRYSLFIRPTATTPAPAAD